MALKTMRIGEYSRFLLSYKVMYGELGCPPLIPARANCLFNILVLAVVPAIEDRQVYSLYTTSPTIIFFILIQ